MARDPIQHNPTKTKPHLTRSAGVWCCRAGRVSYGFSRYIGWGKTPRQAYESREAKIDWDRRFRWPRSLT